MSYLKGITSSWRIVPLGELIAESEYGLSLPTDTTGETPILKMSSIKSGRIDVADLDHVSCSADEREHYSVKAGDILFNRTNSYELVGKSAIVEKTQRIVFASYLVRLRVKKAVEPRFVVYWLNSDRAQKRMKEIATPGVSQSNINPSRLLKDLKIPCPDFDEQRKIADILSTWDEALEKLDALIAARERRKNGLMQQLLTGERRVKGFKARWGTFKLGELFSERVEQNRADLPLLAITGDRGVIPRDELSKRDTSSEDKSKYLRIVPGDIGYNTMRMWQGVSALSALEGIISPAYTVCIPSKKIDGRFAAHFFKLPHTIHLFRRHSQGRWTTRSISNTPTSQLSRCESPPTLMSNALSPIFSMPAMMSCACSAPSARRSKGRSGD